VTLTSGFLLAITEHVGPPCQNDQHNFIESNRYKFMLTTYPAPMQQIFFIFSYTTLSLSASSFIWDEDGFKMLEASTSNGSLSRRWLSEAVYMLANGNLSFGDEDGWIMMRWHCLGTTGDWHGFFKCIG
jgi:hypothetical protein